MPEALTKSSSILIIGGGTWGVSTALHLVRRGYENVTVLDPYDVPSPIAAGNDINKIMEEDFSTDGESSYINQKIAQAATNGWLTDPVFKPYYHPTGIIIAASSPAAIAHMKKTEPINPNDIPLLTATDFQKTMPKGVLTGEFPQWKGIHKQTGAGWVHARKALISAANEAKRLGAKFITGIPHGKVEALIYDENENEGKDIRGARTEDGIAHRADRTILAAGAISDSLLDFKSQLRPTAWTLAHIKMTEEEYSLFQNLPVLFNIEKGFFMEPDEDCHELKICDEHPGYCNWIVQGPDADGRGILQQKKSIPFARHQIPLEAAERVRRFLGETMPRLAERPFAFARICWCADTADRVFLIDRHPEYASLVVAVGASGHGYKDITSIGGFIVDTMEGILDKKVAHAFRWRPETAVDRNWNDTLGRFGGPNIVMDFQKVDGWTEIEYT